VGARHPLEPANNGEWDAAGNHWSRPDTSKGPHLRYAIPKGLPLNGWGAGPFCHFQIPTSKPAEGVYVIGDLVINNNTDEVIFAAGKQPFRGEPLDLFAIYVYACSMLGTD
jgi:hypothetical protein